MSITKLPGDRAGTLDDRGVYGESGKHGEGASPPFPQQTRGLWAALRQVESLPSLASLGCSNSVCSLETALVSVFSIPSERE